MIQTGLIQNAHDDLVTDTAYDFYGLRLATCSLDQRIKIWHLDDKSGTWTVEDDWKAHDAPVSKLSWAHPEFGSILASSSFDRTVKIWEQTSFESEPQVNGNAPSSSSTSRWVQRAALVDAKGTVRAVEFAPHHFGLKLATISSDNYLRVYECLEQPSLATWQMIEGIDVSFIPTSPIASGSAAHTVGLGTPTQTHNTLDVPNASLVNQALQQQHSQPSTRPRMGNREADGGWCLSWCKEHYWGELVAAACGVSGVVKIIQLTPSRQPIGLIALDSSVAPSESHSDAEKSGPSAITSVAWAPSCGRSYHLIGTGGRDGHVRIWKVKPPVEDESDAEQDVDNTDGWSASIVADFADHKSSVGRVEWNITGTVLSSAGNDGRIRLWKASYGNVWRTAGHISVEQADDEELLGEDFDHDEDVVME